MVNKRSLMIIIISAFCLILWAKAENEITQVNLKLFRKWEFDKMPVALGTEFINATNDTIPLRSVAFLWEGINFYDRQTGKKSRAISGSNLRSFISPNGKYAVVLNYDKYAEKEEIVLNYYKDGTNGFSTKIVGYDVVAKPLNNGSFYLLKFEGVDEPTVTGFFLYDSSGNFQNVINFTHRVALADVRLNTSSNGYFVGILYPANDTLIKISVFDTSGKVISNFDFGKMQIVNGYSRDIFVSRLAVSNEGGQVAFIGVSYDCKESKGSHRRFIYSIYTFKLNKETSVVSQNFYSEYFDQSVNNLKFVEDSLLAVAIDSNFILVNLCDNNIVFSHVGAGNILNFDMQRNLIGLRLADKIKILTTDGLLVKELMVSTEKEQNPFILFSEDLKRLLILEKKTLLCYSLTF